MALWFLWKEHLVLCCSLFCFIVSNGLWPVAHRRGTLLAGFALGLAWLNFVALLLRCAFNGLYGPWCFCLNRSPYSRTVEVRLSEQESEQSYGRSVLVRCAALCCRAVSPTA
jgi:hypothetical protein